MSLVELRSLIARHAPRGAGPLPGLTLSRVEAPTSPRATIAAPTLVVVAQGRKRLVLGGRSYDYGPGDHVVVSVHLPVTGSFSEASPTTPFLGVGLTPAPEVVAELLLAGGHRTARVPDGPGLGVGRSSAELIDALVRLLRLIEHPRDRAVLAPLHHREILWRVLTGEQGHLLRRVGLAASGLADVSAAITYLREHHAEALRIADLAAIAGMSESTFHRRFRAVTTMTPIAFQKRIRLEHARLLLVNDGRDVAGVGHAVGYDSPSQFSREYRQLFGAPPGRDAGEVRARLGVAPAEPVLP